MDDEYNLQQIQKKKQRPKDNVDAEIERRAAMMEEENYSIVAETRKKLHVGAVKQKQTTAELQRQGEKLKKVSVDAESVYGNAKTGRKITQDIQDEGRFFRFPHVFRSIKNFFSSDRRKEASLDKEISKKASAEYSAVEDVHFEEDKPDTDENLQLLLKDLKGMRREADVQNDEIKKQKLDIKHINKLNKQSSHIMSRTSQELRKI